MPFESFRKRLMMQTFTWGDAPPGTYVTATASGVRPDLGKPSNPNPVALSNATATTQMSYVVADSVRQKISISSQDWTSAPALVKQGKRFELVPRVSISAHELSSTIQAHERSGVPLIIEGLHKHTEWPKDMFHIDWLREHGQQEAKARNIHDWSDRDLPLGDLIDKLRAMPTSVAPGETERLYGKDAHCPDEWAQWLNDGNVIPSLLRPDGCDNLLQYVPREDRVETLMCYLGIGDTFTPCHKDLCASSGQNIMCYSENDGSSFWFMTESSSAQAAADYFHQLKQELDLETHVITVEELATAPFVVYITEQKLGDMVLVPPRSCHQVVNHGGITIKTSWSRMTLEGLTAAFYHELPIYRRVCRRETYRVKYTIYHTLLRYARDLKKLGTRPQRKSPRSKVASISPAPDRLSLAQQLHQVIKLFDDVLLEEYCQKRQEMVCMAPAAGSDMFPDDSASPSAPEGTTHATCDFCDTDIFQSFFECRDCVAHRQSDAMDTESSHGHTNDDGLLICPSCYVEGRTCRCGNMEPRQCRDFGNLLRDRNWAAQIFQQSDIGFRVEWTLEEQDILSRRRLSIFEAAYALYIFRKAKYHRRSLDKPTRKCSRDNRTHDVAPHALLRCKGCHFGLCFECILPLGIHSAEAILINQCDASHETWHERHTDQDIFIKARPKVEDAEKRGFRCSMRHKLVITASDFPTCVPSNVKFTKPGWYDKVVQTTIIPTENSEHYVVSGLATSSASTPMSALSSLPTTPSVTSHDLPDDEALSTLLIGARSEPSLGMQVHFSVRPTIEAANTAGGQITSITGLPGTILQKRKRQVLDYVEVPPLRKVAKQNIAQINMIGNEQEKITGPNDDIEMADATTPALAKVTSSEPSYKPKAQGQPIEGPSILSLTVVDSLPETTLTKEKEPARNPVPFSTSASDIHGSQPASFSPLATETSQANISPIITTPNTPNNTVTNSAPSTIVVSIHPQTSAIRSPNHSQTAIPPQIGIPSSSSPATIHPLVAAKRAPAEKKLASLNDRLLKVEDTLGKEQKKHKVAERRQAQLAEKIRGVQDDFDTLSRSQKSQRQHFSRQEDLEKDLRKRVGNLEAEVVRLQTEIVELRRPRPEIITKEMAIQAAYQILRIFEPSHNNNSQPSHNNGSQRPHHTQIQSRHNGLHRNNRVQYNNQPRHNQWFRSEHSNNNQVWGLSQASQFPSNHNWNDTDPFPDRDDSTRSTYAHHGPPTGYNTNNPQRSPASNGQSSHPIPVVGSDGRQIDDDYRTGYGRHWGPEYPRSGANAIDSLSRDVRWGSNAGDSHSPDSASNGDVDRHDRSSRSDRDHGSSEHWEDEYEQLDENTPSPTAVPSTEHHLAIEATISSPVITPSIGPPPLADNPWAE